MSQTQVYNRKINAWVKYNCRPGGKSKILDVKEKNPQVPFKNVRRRRRLF